MIEAEQTSPRKTVLPAIHPGQEVPASMMVVVLVVVVVMVMVVVVLVVVMVVIMMVATRQDGSKLNDVDKAAEAARNKQNHN